MSGGTDMIIQWAFLPKKYGYNMNLLSCPPFQVCYGRQDICLLPYLCKCNSQWDSIFCYW